MILDHPGDPPHRLELGADRPAIPLKPGLARPAPTPISPQAHRKFLDRPSPSGFQPAVPQRLELQPALLAEVIWIPEPEVLRALQLIVVLGEQRLVLLPAGLIDGFAEVLRSRQTNLGS